jgi:Tol biopolymer transport system component
MPSSNRPPAVTRLRRARAALILSCALVLGVPVSSAAAAPVRNGAIAFVDTSTGAPGIGVAHADGSDHRLLTRPLPMVGEPSWNRQSGLIAFDLGRTIATVRPDGRGLRHLTVSHGTTDSSPVWSPDGTHVAFYRVTDTNGSTTDAVVVADLHGRRQRPFALVNAEIGQSAGNSAVFPPRWSRDGRALTIPVYDSHGRAARLSIDVRTGRRTIVDTVGRCLNMLVPAPRGALSVCAVAGPHDGENVWVMRSGKPVRRLLSADSSATDAFPGTPAWDPSGTRIAIGIGIDRVSVISIDGSRRTTYRVLLHAPGDQAGYGAREPLAASWSADGSHIAIAAGGNGWGLESLDVRSGRLQLLVSHSEDSEPQFSPDGSRLAYLHTGALGSTGIRLFDGLRGTSARLMTSVADPGMAVYSWSPASTDIAFITDTASLAVIALDGSKPRVIAADATSDPTWSPDAHSIAYDVVHGFAGGSSDGNGIHFVHADGSASPLSQIPGTNYLQWWSPDGASVAFSGDNGTEELQLETGTVTKPDNWFGGRGVGLLRGAALSPDGTRALFASFGFGKYAVFYSIFLTGLDGTRIAAVQAAAPAIWSPDGLYVAYQDRGGDGQDVYAVDPDRIAITTPTDLVTAVAYIENASQPTWQPLPA